MSFLSYFQYRFRSSGKTTHTTVMQVQLYQMELTIVSDRIARVFNRSGVTRAVTLGISKASDRVPHTGFLHKL